MSFAFRAWMIMVAAFSPSVSVAELAAAVPGAAVHGDGDVRVTALASDSRKATPGALFFAVKGVVQDGADFVADAVRRGAVAIVAEAGVDAPAGLPCIRVADGRTACRSPTSCRTAARRLPARCSSPAAAARRTA